MKVKKMIKNIIALGTGLTMLGATVFGAMAADLGQYPSQYINDGEFDGLMVVGARASTSDVLGIVDIATSLQFQSKTDKVVTEGTGKTITSLSGDAYEFGTSNNKLEIDEFLGNVKSTVTSNEFGPLAKTTTRTRKGTTSVKQYLKFNSTNGLKIVYDEQDDIVGQYLTCKDKENLFTYEVQFTDGLYSNIYESETSNKRQDNTGYLNDLDDANIYMLGHSYTITGGHVTNCATGDIKLTFMTGSTEVVMQEYEDKTVVINEKEYQIKVTIVSDGGNGDNSVKLMVNNEQTNKLYEGDTYTFRDGIILGIKDIMANEGSETGGQDIVSFYLGANKIEFDNGNVEIEEERIEDADVNVKCSVTNDEVRISSIKYTLKADAEESGDLIVMDGESVRSNLNEPQGMLGTNWDIKYLGMNSEETYQVRIDADGDDRYEISFVTQSDNEYTMPLVYTTASPTPQLLAGEDDETGLILTGSQPITADDYFILTADPANIDEFTHILQLEEIDEDIATLIEVGSNEVIEIQYETLPATAEFVVGGDTFAITVNTNNVIIPATTNVIRLKNGHKLEINPTTFDVTFTTPGTITDDNIPQSFVVDISKTVDNDVDLDVTTGITMVSDDTDYQRGTTKFGINVRQDTDDVDELLITVPEEQVFPIVALTGESYSVDSIDSIEGGIIIPEYKAIPVGKAVLDSEITDMAGDNLIVIGGPCANTVAATILGIPSTAPGCYEQFPVKEGEGIIKMVDTGEKVSMLVAGYTAKDTRDASKVLAQFETYKDQLTGKDEVVVTGTQIRSPIVESVVDTNETTNGTTTTENGSI